MLCPGTGRAGVRESAGCGAGMVSTDDDEAPPWLARTAASAGLSTGTAQASEPGHAYQTHEAGAGYRTVRTMKDRSPMIAVEQPEAPLEQRLHPRPLPRLKLALHTRPPPVRALAIEKRARQRADEPRDKHRVEVRLEARDGHPAAVRARVHVVERRAAVDRPAHARHRRRRARRRRARERAHAEAARARRPRQRRLEQRERREVARARDHVRLDDLPEAALGAFEERDEDAEGAGQAAAAKVGNEVQGKRWFGRISWQHLQVGEQLMRITRSSTDRENAAQCQVIQIVPCFPVRQHRWSDCVELTRHVLMNACIDAIQLDSIAFKTTTTNLKERSYNMRPVNVMFEMSTRLLTPQV